MDIAPTREIVEHYEEILPSGKVAHLVQYADPSGRRKGKRFKRKIDAENHERKMRSDVRIGEWFDPARGKQRVGAYADRVIDTASLRPSTRASYEQALRLHIIPKLGNHHLSAVTPEDVRELLSRMPGRGRPRSIRPTGSFVG